MDEERRAAGEDDLAGPTKIGKRTRDEPQVGRDRPQRSTQQRVARSRRGAHAHDAKPVAADRLVRHGIPHAAHADEYDVASLRDVAPRVAQRVLADRPEIRRQPVADHHGVAFDHAL